MVPTPLEELGFHERVLQALEDHGIPSLYPPQEEAWKAIRQGGNVMVAIPTASGKSLIAYLALMRNFLETGRKGMFIVPLRALASEKFEELKELSKAIGWRVGIATGDLDEKSPRLGSNDIIVCTSEKADSLLRHDAGWVTDMGCIVSDEVHLLNDAGRGPTLEVVLSQFRARVPKAQIIALSATVGNAKDVAGWLEATHIHSDWRPVELRKGTYWGNVLQFQGNPAEKLEHQKDPTSALVAQTLQDGGQCLVFVSTRRSAESLAQKIAPVVRDLLSAEDLLACEKAIEEAFGNREERDSPLHKKVEVLAKAGVAFHTAGLDSRQRRFVEDAFRKRILKVITATPTLAAGVNTPARRVIIRDLTRFEAGLGNSFLPVLEVQQMMGRAGRPRFDPVGEAVLIAKDDERAQMYEDTYLNGEPEPVVSKLGADRALRMHCLSAVASGSCRSEAEVLKFFLSTFWAHEQSEWRVTDAVRDVLMYLESEGFLVEDEEGLLTPTPFGKRTSDLYIDPETALRMKTSFESDRPPTAFGFLMVLAGSPDLLKVYLRKGDEWVEPLLMQHWQDVMLLDDLQDREDALSSAKTTALMLDWIEESTQVEMEKKFNVGPGDIRMKVDSARWLMHAYAELARTTRTEWVQPLQDLEVRLEHGVKKELLPVLTLKGVGRARARTLFAAGLDSIPKLRKIPIVRLAGLPGFGPLLAKRILEQVGVEVDELPIQEPDPTLPDAPLQEADTKAKGQTSLSQW